MNTGNRLSEKAFSALQRGDFGTAQALAEQALSSGGPHAPMHFVAGLAALEQRDPVRASAYLERVADSGEFALPATVHLARAYVMMQRFVDAATRVDRAVAQAGSDPTVLDSCAVVLTACGQHEQALALFQRAAERAPRNPGVRYNLATAWMAVGNLDEAERELDACIAMDPLHWRAHHALSSLRRQTPAQNHVERLTQALKQVSGRVTASLYIGMALAKELEDLGRYDESLRRLTDAKSGPGRMLAHTSGKDRALMDALASIALPAQGEEHGFDSEEPIFIIGMPRTGTTLVDRILSSHPEVTSAGELHQFASALKRTAGGQQFNLFSPDDLRRLKDLDWSRLGREYVESTRPLTGQTRRFIDKLPHNFLYAGLIASALPKATIICVLRDPVDTCLSNFRQLFAPESPYFDYSYDLLTTGEYYCAFRHLMQHWHRAFPGRIHEVWYEDIVTDQEGATRKLLDACGLDWNDACMDFQNNKSPVTTASLVQVRSPIYRSAMQRWRQYGEAISPLVRLLDTAGFPPLDVRDASHADD